MAVNPLYQSNDSPNNSTQPTKSVNRQGVYVPRTHNTFDNSYFHYKTQKFGQYEPFFVMEGVPGDNIPLHNSHNVRSLPMSSPFLSELRLNKDYFMVPMQSILPNTWELIYKTPSQGDDVPDNANCLFPAFSLRQGASIFNSLWQEFNRKLFDAQSPNYGVAFRILLILEMFLSQGSLLSQMGYHMNPKIVSVDGNFYRSFDSYFDFIVSQIQSVSLRVKLSEEESVSLRYGYDDANCSLHQLVSVLRSYGSDAIIDEFLMFTDDLQENRIENLPYFPQTDDFGSDINLSRILAYQVSCSQFYVNPQIDFIYNAQIYRDNLYTLWRTLMISQGGNNSIKTFTYNGILVPYDYASKAYFSDVVLSIIEGRVNNFALLYDYLYAIFGHRESLRFGDYFTDSRTRPLADGDNSISVTDSSSVDVIDVTKKIVYQRFRNAVVKLGNNFGDYLRGIFGTTPSPDYHFPKFISHSDHVIKAFEVSNTTLDEQGKIVSNLDSHDERYAFEVSVDMPCVILGISYFSVPRVYMQTKDRQFFHRDRYDMFNPMLQYIGDQVVYNHELTDDGSAFEIFGYQSRYNEYKQRYSVVSGAFATSLPAWTFVADSIFDPVDDIIIERNQSPGYIRAHDYEFNRFFAQMPGYSLSTAFHFIVVYNNKCMSNRPMEVNPSIL